MHSFKTYRLAFVSQLTDPMKPSMVPYAALRLGAPVGAPDPREGFPSDARVNWFD